jgi:hypothetical protein
MRSLRNCVIATIPTLLLAGCAPRVATSFWRIGTPADSVREGYAVLYEGSKMRHCYPITEWKDITSHNAQFTSHNSDTYHELHHHGVAVESKLMAYRIYFDKKQTIDPYCKRTPQMELANSYWYPNDSLLAAGYGDDILRVSGTVGVGSVKYWNGQKHVHIEPVEERSQRIVSRKKDQATIEVADKGWMPSAGSSVDMSVQYTMHAGHRDMRCDVTISEPVEGLCTGVQSIPAKGPQPTANSQWTSEELPNGVLLASWGTDWPVNDSAKFAKETVGIAVFIPKAYAGKMVQDKSNNLCLLKQNAVSRQPQEGYHAHFYLTCCGATKEKHPVATTASEWFAYLRRWVKKLK